MLPKLYPKYDKIIKIFKNWKKGIPIKVLKILS